MKDPRPRRRAIRCHECGSALITPMELKTGECDECKKFLDRCDASDFAYDLAHEAFTDADLPW